MERVRPSPFFNNSFMKSKVITNIFGESLSDEN